MTNSRVLFEITGTDAEHFLQGLVTNDVDRLADGMVYAAILTPQGKYLADFFLSRRGEAIVMDVAESLSQSLLMRLNMYKLRADVAITPLALHVHRGTGDTPVDGFADPRDPSLG